MNDMAAFCRRFWYPSESALSLSDDGFLWNDDGEFARHINPDLVDLTGLRERRCLFLLGEPGTGKSTSVEQEVEALRQSGELVLLAPLELTASDESVVENVFRASEWSDWRQGRHLHVFLDSYDECRSSLDKLAQVLVREFRKLETRDRLTLRITCRAGIPLDYLRENLSRLWSDDVLSYSLAPLRFSDAQAIARKQGIIDTDALFADLRRVDAMPLATTPMSLRMIGNVYQDGPHNLPSSREQLFEFGCRLLCTEHNPSRQTSGIARLTPDERLAIASRIAVASLFCGRIGVSLAYSGTIDNRDWVTVDDLRHFVSSESPKITIDAISEVAQDTQLFVPAGDGRVRWVHRSYAEFLAARYVRSASLQQLRALLCVPSLEHRLIPQLRGVAAWLDRRSDFLKMLLSTEPETLLSTDLSSQSEQTRQDAVAAILDAVRRGTFSGGANFYGKLLRLNHPHILNQLLPIISDRSASFSLRQIAIDIAAECRLPEIASTLLVIVGDASEDDLTRECALSALAIDLSVAPAAQLLGLLSQLPERLSDSFRGHVLPGLWPQSITVDQVLPLLWPLNQPNNIGPFWVFISRDFVKGLRAADLSAVFTWLESLSEEQLRESAFSDLLDGVLITAWEAISELNDHTAFGRAFWRKLRAGLWSSDDQLRARLEALAENQATRHLLAKALIATVPAGLENAWWYVHSFVPTIVHEDDAVWLASLLEESQIKQRELLVQLLARLFPRCSQPARDALSSIGQHHADLAEALQPFSGRSSSDTLQATGPREADPNHETHEGRVNNHNELSEVQASVIMRLDEVEAGNTDSWIALVRLMTLEGRYENRRQSDLSAGPLWAGADEVFRSRIINAAVNFLVHSTPDSESWIDNPDLHGGEPIRAGVAALRVLKDHAAEELTNLSPELWEKWLPALLDYLPQDDLDVISDLCRRAFAAASAPFLVTLKRYLVREAGGVLHWQSIESGGRVNRSAPRPTNVLHRMKACWNDLVAAVVRDIVDDPDTNVAVHGSCVEALFRHGDQPTIVQTLSYLNCPPPFSEMSRERLIQRAALLLKHNPDLAVPALSKYAAALPRICRQILQRWISHAPFAADGELVQQVEEHTAGEFYVLLRTLFGSSRTIHRGAHTETADETANRMCNGVLQHLAGKATLSAVRAIEQIARRFSDDLNVQHYRIAAEQMALSQMWTPLSPEVLFEFLADDSKRIVRSDVELLQLLQESLKRYEQELQGETPQNFTLWDKDRPKEEERLSDAVRRHFERDLRDRGVVTNREVEIRQKQGGGGSPGEITDIHVDAVAPISEAEVFGRIRVIVEVKGCWNRELLIAMKTQLRDRYLVDNDCQAGLYVVGDFLCPQWDIADTRRSTAEKLMPKPTEVAASHFADQAHRLSTDRVLLEAFVLRCSLR